MQRALHDRTHGPAGPENHKLESAFRSAGLLVALFLTVLILLLRIFVSRAV